MSTQIAHEATSSEVARLLDTCIETCADGGKGYATAAADVKDAGLAALFQGSSDERGRFVADLQAAARMLGATRDEEPGSTRAMAHRAWMDACRAVAGRRDSLMIQECVRGEEAALRAYEAALTRTPLRTLPPAIRAMVQMQYLTIREALGDLKDRLLTVRHEQ